MKTYIQERLKMHKTTKGLWEDGILTPTEPNPEERKITMLQLEAVIHELECLYEYCKMEEDN